MVAVKPRTPAKAPSPSDARHARQVHVWRDDELRWDISYATDDQRETWERVTKPVRKGGVHVATIERAKQIDEAEARATKRYFDPNGAEGKAWLAEFSKPACPLLTHN